MENALIKTLKLIFLSSLLIVQSCFVYGKKDGLYLSSAIKGKGELNSVLTSVDVSNNVVTIKGSGFSNVTFAKLSGTNLNADLKIDSKSDSQIIASATSAISLLVGQAFNLVIGTAEAQATYAVTFTLQNGAINLNHLSSLGATTAGQILKFDGTTWGIGTLSSSQTYKGTWDASSHMPDITSLGSFDEGDYYIVSAIGTYNSAVLTAGSATFNVGDWVMFNGATWDQVVNNSISGSGTANYIPYFSASKTLANSPLAISGSNVGIGTTTPGTSLDVKGVLRLSGATSGYVGFAPAAAAGSTTYTLPAADGTNGQVLTTNASGVLSWTSIAVSGGTVTSVTSANTDISVATGTSTPVLTLNSGTGANQIVKLNGSSQLPAVDGSLLTSLNSANLGSAVAVTKGGTGLAVGVSGGIPYYSSTTTMASSALLGLNGVLLGGGAGASPTSTTAGSADQVLRIPGAGGAPAFGAIDLTKSAAVTGALPIANGGTGAATLGAAQSALGITVGGATTGSAAIVGTGGVVANKICSGDSSGGGISCVNTTSSFLAGSISDESGTGALLFGTAPTISSPVIANIAPAANFTLTQNSVVPFTSEETGAVANTLYLKAGKIGMGTASPQSTMHLKLPILASSSFLIEGDSTGGISSARMGFVDVNGGSATTSPAWYFDNNADSFRVYRQPNISNFGTTYFKITNSGYVGIGSNINPTGVFEVQGGTAAANTHGTHITLAAQNGGTGTSTGGNIVLTPGAGGGGSWPGGFVSISQTTVGKVLSVARHGSDSYVSTSSSLSNPRLNSVFSNSFSADGNTSINSYEVRNGSGVGQLGYFGAVSITGAANYSPALVWGQKTSTSTYAERMRMDSNGNLGIGTDAPDEKLVVYNGTTTGKYTTSGWTHSSDRRLKHDITPIENSLEKILKLRGVKYKFNSDPENKTQIGFIAQEVESIFPEVVVNDDKGWKSMVYDNLVAPLVESVKALYKRIVGVESQQLASEAKIKELQIKNQSLQAKNEELEKRLEKIEKMLKK